MSGFFLCMGYYFVEIDTPTLGDNAPVEVPYPIPQIPIKIMGGFCTFVEPFVHEPGNET